MLRSNICPAGTEWSKEVMYEKAMQHAQQGVKVWIEKLLPSATYVAEGEALLAELSRLISQNDPVGKKTDKMQRRK